MITRIVTKRGYFCSFLFLKDVYIFLKEVEREGKAFHMPVHSPGGCNISSQETHLCVPPGWQGRQHLDRPQYGYSQALHRELDWKQSRPNSKSHHMKRLSQATAWPTTPFKPFPTCVGRSDSACLISDLCQFWIPPLSHVSMNWSRTRSPLHA